MMSRAFSIAEIEDALSRDGVLSHEPDGSLICVTRSSGEGADGYRFHIQCGRGSFATTVKITNSEAKETSISDWEDTTAIRQLGPFTYRAVMTPLAFIFAGSLVPLVMPGAKGNELNAFLFIVLSGVFGFALGRAVDALVEIARKLPTSETLERDGG